MAAPMQLLGNSEEGEEGEAPLDAPEVPELHHRAPLTSWPVAEISVDAGPDGTYAVEVRSQVPPGVRPVRPVRSVRPGPTVTNHVVSVPDGFAEALGCGLIEPEELIERSFEFLLEREPPTSILRRFSLDVIGDYFPDYPSEIRRRCREGRG